MKVILLATVCLLPFSLFAQTPIPRAPQRIVPPHGQAVSEEAALKENIVIRLQGTTTTSSDIDLSLTGIGPRFTADQVVNDDTVLTCEYLVSTTETGYKVTYSVSTRIKLTNQNGTEYRDVSISGTVLCSADHAVILVRNGPKPLQLTITKEVKASSKE